MFLGSMFASSEPTPLKHGALSGYRMVGRAGRVTSRVRVSSMASVQIVQSILQPPAPTKVVGTSKYAKAAA